MNLYIASSPRKSFVVVINKNTFLATENKFFLSNMQTNMNGFHLGRNVLLTV